MDPLIAEDLLLLLLDDDSGRVTESHLDILMGGALLTELALVGAVGVGDRTGLLRSRKVRPLAASPALADDLLRRALTIVGEKDRSAQDLVQRLGKGVRRPLLDRLVGRGLVREEQSRVLGLFPRTRWPAVDRAREADVRDRLQRSLVGGAEPDQRTAALVALLHAVDRAHQEVRLEGVPAREVRRRAKEIAESDWSAAAVRDAVQAAQAAVMAAVVATTVAGASAGSG